LVIFSAGWTALTTRQNFGFLKLTSEQHTSEPVLVAWPRTTKALEARGPSSPTFHFTVRPARVACGPVPATLNSCGTIAVRTTSLRVASVRLVSLSL